jgi:D-sedoheptulose 7-phosphate isomerase
LSLTRPFRPDKEARTQGAPAPAEASHSGDPILEGFQRLYADHALAFERSRALLAPAAKLAEAVIATLKDGGKLLLCGNGGSAADSQHLAAEFTIRFEKKRRALPAIALTTDTSVLTAAGNDFGFEHIFARQVEAHGQPGDMLLALTTSGSSANIVAALETARRLGLKTACLTGRDGGDVAARHLADHCLVVPATETARIQEIHIFLGHLLCGAADGAFAAE